MNTNIKLLPFLILAIALLVIAVINYSDPMSKLFSASALICLLALRREMMNNEIIDNE